MKRADVIDNKNIQPGDVVIGLESYGKAHILKSSLSSHHTP